LDSSVEWRTESKALEKSRDITDNIWIGLKQVGDGVEKEDDGSRRRTSGAKGELIRKVDTGWRCKEGWVKVCLLQFAPSSV